MGGQNEDFAFKEDGQLVQLPNGGIYLRYIEHQEESAVPVQFRLDGEKVHLHRHGPHETRLEFLAGQTTKTRYRTDYGVINLEVETTALAKEIDVAGQQGQLSVAYHLKNNGAVLGSYRIELQFTA